ncbi:MAG: hypothetical protein RHS_1005 [Robinsoniella sp. RHS]|uniref:glycosyltransferase family 2 protein n=1 Tax=Robinsoniella sp. RHS TaxID=1504536 RepID=UPI00064AC20C|nr:MAG: hypothetical protein RHS_1005 [Robinsoniella sp. RHS]
MSNKVYNDKVSIILVNYNGNNDTLECVKSLKQIAYTNYEIIVVDNASANVDYIKSELNESVIFLQAEKNLGFAGGNNLGISYALDNGAEYVVLLNNDTTVDKNFISDMVFSSKKNKDNGIVTGKILFHSKPDYIWYAGGEMNLNKAKIRHFGIRTKDKKIIEEKYVNFATGCLMLIPKNVIETVGYLDDQYFMYCEDAEFCVRLKKNGYSIIYNSEAVIYHKVSASSGGAGSKLSQYYRTRNELYLVSHYSDHKIQGIIFCLLRFLKRIMKGQFSVNCVRYGIRDYMNSNMGMTNISFR